MTPDLIPCPLPQQEWEGSALRTNRHYNQTCPTWRFHRAPDVPSLTLIAGNAWTFKICYIVVQLNGSSGNTKSFISCCQANQA